MNSNLLETQRLYLRYFFENDGQKVYKMSREEGILKWIPDQVYADLYEAKEALAYLTSHYEKLPMPQKNPFVVGIVLKETEEMIGHVGLSPFGKQFVEIGFAIETKEQGKGYATEAVVTMTNWALNQLKIPFLLGIAAKENQASQNVLEKSGYYFLEEMKLQSTGNQTIILDDFAKSIQKSFRPTWRNLLRRLLIEISRQARNDENLDFLTFCESVILVK